MRENNKKKGFTLVELLVVIAILAILAAVSVVGYLSFTEKAKKSVDQQAVTEMNTILSGEESLGNRPENISEVIDILLKHNYNGDFTTYSNEYQIGWMPEENVIVLINGEKIDFPEKYKKDSFSDGEVLPFFSIETEEQLKNLINNSEKKDILLSKDLELTAPLNISRSITLIGFGKTVISNFPISFNTEKGEDIKIKNITFEKPQNQNKNASMIYASNLKSKLIIEDCTFIDTQWDCVQVTPENGSEVIINNCTFKNINNKSHRYLHIEATDTSGNCDVKITVTNNHFGTSDKVNNSIIDLDFFDYNNNLIAYNNTFEDTKDKLTEKEAIYICKTSSDVMDYNKAYEFLTKKQ